MVGTTSEVIDVVCCENWPPLGIGDVVSPVREAVLTVNTKWGTISIQILDDIPQEENFDFIVKSESNKFWLVRFEPYDV